MKQTIYELELSLLEPGTRHSQTELEKLIADDFIEFGSSGKVYYKLDLLKTLPSEGIREFIMTDFAIKELSQFVILATYKTTEDGAISLRSSIWKKYRDEWQMIFHQGTKVTIE